MIGVTPPNAAGWMRVCVRDGLRNHLGCCCSCCGFKVFRRWWVLTVLIAMMLWIRMHLDAEGIMLSNWRRCGEYHLHQFNHSSIHDPYIHPSLHQSIYSSTHPSMTHPCIHLFIHSSSHPLIHPSANTSMHIFMRNGVWRIHFDHFVMVSSNHYTLHAVTKPCLIRICVYLYTCSDRTIKCHIRLITLLHAS